MNFNMRITEDEKKQIEAKAKENGFTSVSTYVKYLVTNVKLEALVPKDKK